MHAVKLFAIMLTLCAVTAVAKDKTQYQTGKLIDLRRYETGAGAARAQGAFCFAIQVDDVAYLSTYSPYWRGSYEPTDFLVGDPVEVKLKGNNLLIKKPSGGDLKTSVTRRQRITPENPPVTCGLPVTVKN